MISSYRSVAEKANSNSGVFNLSLYIGSLGCLSLFSGKNSLSKGRLSEELLYEHVAKELSDGFLREGLWAKAFSLADGAKP